MYFIYLSTHSFDDIEEYLKFILIHIKKVHGWTKIHVDTDLCWIYELKKIIDLKLQIYKISNVFRQIIKM